MKARTHLLAAVALSLVFFVQALLGSLRESLTWDEPIYIAAGCSYLGLNDYRMNIESPPLMKQLHAALPMLLLPIALPPTDNAVWKEARHFDYPDQFVFLNGERIREIAFWSRLPVLCIGAALVLVIAWWGWQLYGPLPALVGACVAAFSPDLLAHSGFAAQDLGSTAFMFFSAVTFWRACRGRRTRDWLLCGVLTGLALLTKFNALLLGPILLLLGGYVLLRGRIGLRPLVAGYAWIGLIAIVLIGADYHLAFDYPLYLRGIASYPVNIAHDYRPYLCGRIGDGSFWYYHFVAFCLKEPVPILLLLGLAAFRAFRDPSHRDATAFLLLPAAVVLTASCFDQAEVGIRHILPAFPYLFVFTGQAIAGTPDATGRRSRWPQVAVVALLLWTAVEAVRIFPHHLSYINQLAGGPERGPYLLDDSNIDWGQDLPALATWLRAHPEARPLRLAYFGNVPPALYGVEAETMPVGDIVHPRSGTYAVSAHQLVWFRKNSRKLGWDGDWLDKYTPMDRAGYSIYIYRFPGAERR